MRPNEDCNFLHKLVDESAEKGKAGGFLQILVPFLGKVVFLPGQGWEGWKREGR